MAGLEQPVSLQQLRKLCALRTSTVCPALAELIDSGIVYRDSRGYQLKEPHSKSTAVSLSRFIEEKTRNGPLMARDRAPPACIREKAGPNYR